MARGLFLHQSLRARGRVPSVAPLCADDSLCASCRAVSSEKCIRTFMCVPCFFLERKKTCCIEGSARAGELTQVIHSSIMAFAFVAASRAACSAASTASLPASGGAPSTSLSESAKASDGPPSGAMAQPESSHTTALASVRARVRRARVLVAYGTTSQPRETPERRQRAWRGTQPRNKRASCARARTHTAPPGCARRIADCSCESVALARDCPLNEARGRAPVRNAPWREHSAARSPTRHRRGRCRPGAAPMSRALRPV